LAIAAGFNGSQSLGAGATLVLGSYASSASATLSGFAQLSGNLTLHARSVDATNQSRAFAKAQNTLANSPIVAALGKFLAGIDLSGVADGVTIDPHVVGPDVSLAAAVV